MVLLLFSRSSEDHYKQATIFKSEKRDDMVKEGYRIVGNSGDQWSDLLGSSLAIRSFKLPNPMYHISWLSFRLICVHTYIHKSVSEYRGIKYCKNWLSTVPIYSYKLPCLPFALLPSSWSNNSLIWQKKNLVMISVPSLM